MNAMEYDGVQGDAIMLFRFSFGQERADAAIVEGDAPCGGSNYEVEVDGHT